MTALAPYDRRALARPETWLGSGSMLRFELADSHGREQAFAVGIMAVRDVLRTPALTPLPRAPAGVVGGLNLRGRVVVVLDPRVPLGLNTTPEPPAMLVVVAHGPASYALLADTVVDVADLPAELYAPMPATLPAAWAAISDGMFRLPERLVVVLSIPRLLTAIGGSQTLA